MLRAKIAMAALVCAAMPLGWGFPVPSPEPPPDPPGFALAVSGSFLGVNVHEIDSRRAGELQLKEERGVEITTVTEGSPAAEAGLRKGDVVLGYNGQRVEGAEQFIRLVRETPAGRKVELTVWREGREQALAATIGQRKQAVATVRGQIFGPDGFTGIRIPEFRMPDLPRAHVSWRSQSLGIEAESVDGQLAEFFGVDRGVLVRRVEKGSLAEQSGLKAGDVITRIEQTAVDSPADVSRLMRAGTEAKTQSISVIRDRKETMLSVTIEPARVRGRSVAKQ